MSVNTNKSVIVISTGGSVLKSILSEQAFEKLDPILITDRECSFEKWYHHQNFQYTLVSLHSKNRFEFYKRLKSELQAREICPSWFLLFYLDFPSYQWRKDFPDKLINFHPSLLPAFPGMNPDFDISLIRPVVIGSTVEIIRSKMDQGLQLAQSVNYFDTKENFETARHRVFLQQCALCLQVIEWINNERITLNGDYAFVKNSIFRNGEEFFPILDKPVESFYKLLLKK